MEQSTQLLTRSQESFGKLGYAPKFAVLFNVLTRKKRQRLLDAGFKEAFAKPLRKKSFEHFLGKVHYWQDMDN